MRMTEEMEIATRIYQQLGGQRFRVMTGARNMSYGGRALRFALPGTMTKGGVNRVTIELNDSDTYDVTFYRLRKNEIHSQHTVKGIYCDMLLDIIKEATGLAVKL